MDIQRSNILGVGVSAVNIDQTLAMIDGWIEQREPHYVCVTGVHGVMESQRDNTVLRIHNSAGMVVPDGMPLVWLSRLKGHKKVQRIYGPELMLSLCEHSLKLGYRHFFFGGASGVPEKLVVNLQQLFPKLVVAGIFSPPFRPMTDEEDQKVVEVINGTEPDIVWIGLSTPKQERWMTDHIERLTAQVLIGVGAAFDFIAGTKRQAPRWMQRNGLEWFFRLITEPRRLWRRYLINNPAFLWLILLQALGIKEYSLE